MNDFTVKPIEEFPAYFEQSGRIFGIPDGIVNPKEIVPVEFIAVIPEDEGDREYAVKPFDFQVKSGSVYFRVKMNFPSETEGEVVEVVKNCKQSGGELSYVTDSKFPTVPEISRITGKVGNVDFTVGEYNGETTSIASREYPEIMYFIENAMPSGNGVLLSVEHGRPGARPEGLLSWRDGSRTMEKWKDKGRLWK